MKKYYIVLSILAVMLGSCKDDTNPPKLDFQEIRKSGVEVSYHDVTIHDTVNMTNNNAEVLLFYSQDSLVGSQWYGGSKSSMIPALTKKEGYVMLTTKVTGLEAGVRYYYAYAFSSLFDVKRGVNPKMGVTRSFETLKNLAPLVETVGCGDYGFSRAEIFVEKISDNSDSQPTSWGVCYSHQSMPTVNDSVVTCQSKDDGIVQLTLSKLEAGTKYYFRAFGINQYGTSYGEEQSMTTVSASVMSVETKSPTVVMSNYAIVAGEITSHAALNITERGFYISSTNTVPDNNDIRLVSEVSGEGAYQVLADGLNGGTTYYVRAYAVCQYGELMGNVVSFVTGQ